MYDKKIAYLHYIKNGELIRNAGHVKIMFKGNSICFEVYTKDTNIDWNGAYDMISLGKNLFKDKIHIERGQAEYKKRFNVDKKDKTEFPYGLKIIIGEEEYLEAVWDAGEKQTERNGGKELLPENRTAEGEDETEEEVTSYETAARNVAVPRNTTAEIKSAAMKKMQTEVMREIKKEEEISSGKMQKLSEMLTFSVPAETYENKWGELCKKYDIVHPFGNKEEYLSIKPRDFIIFPEKYQNLVNNSFLLHGYYNYQHIILGKKEDGGQNVYYIGVPGVYYEREKMVAIMFGFEGFECGSKRASNGGFGYYMRRVEL